MLGAIIGDIIGSSYEKMPTKEEDFALFTGMSHITDDTVLTIAVADALMNKKDLVDTLKEYTLAFPRAGYGKTFLEWAKSDSREPYNSWGNGSAMRVSPVAWLYDSMEDVLRVAKETAEVTHNHPEGIKGAQAIAACIFLARKGAAKGDIEEFVTTTFGYDLNRTIKKIRPSYKFDVSCQGSCPEAIIAFIDSISYEDCIRKAVSLGGDSDTIACMAGGIAEAYYSEFPSHKIQSDLLKKAEEYWQNEKLLNVINQFLERTKETDAETKEFIPLWEQTLNNIQQLPQTQESLTDQFHKLYHVANKFGLYDAADFIRYNILKK